CARRTYGYDGNWYFDVW
nr:immunoglobulin heavy chain junction region [Mus musculus]MBK4185982.1 immunoglobulin heavy chain junction region [Mus musculus]